MSNEIKNLLKKLAKTYPDSYVIFGRKSCPFCVRAEEFLKENNISYHYINTNELNNEHIKELIKLANYSTTVPQIFYLHSSPSSKITHTGGYLDLIQKCKI